MWIKTANSVGINSSIIQGNDLVLDNFGNCYVTGYFGGTATFGSLGPVTSTADLDAFVAKFRQSDGAALWVRKGPAGPRSAYGYGIAVDNTGNIYYTGNFGTGTNVLQGNLNTLQVSTTADYDAFVAKYNSNGEILWASKTQSSGSSGIFQPSTFGADIAVDNQGNSYITGTIQAQSIQFGSPSITLGNPVASFYIAKLNTQGQFLWARGATGGGAGKFAGGNLISIGSNGNLFATGMVIGNFWFGNINVINSGPNHDNFIAKYDHLTGNIICMNIPNKGLPSNQAALNSLATDKQGKVFVGGLNQGNNTYGYIPVTSATHKFLATLSEDCCKNQILIQNVTYDDPYSGFAVHAANFITAGFNVGLAGTGNVVVNPGNRVTYAASTTIALKDGFKALIGSEFHALISGCANSNAR